MKMGESEHDDSFLVDRVNDFEWEFMDETSANLFSLD
jgi:hypothetical protein